MILVILCILLIYTWNHQLNHDSGGNKLIHIAMQIVFSHQQSDHKNICIARLDKLIRYSRKL